MRTVAATDGGGDGGGTIDVTDFIGRSGRKVRMVRRVVGYLVSSRCQQHVVVWNLPARNFEDFV